MNNFDNKAVDVNAMIKNLKGKEDPVLLKTLFDMVCFEKPIIKENKNVSQLSDDELFGKFFPYNFNHTEKRYLLPYFQEVYNRFALNNNHDGRYQVKFNPTKDFKPYGQTSAYNSDIILNYSFVSKMKKKDFDYYLGADRRTVSSFMLMTLFHEAEHTFQFDKALDFATNKDVSGKNAIFLLELLVKKYVFENAVDGKLPENLKNFASKINSSYSLSFMEHDANMTAFNTASNLIKTNILGNNHKIVMKDALERRCKTFLEYNIFNCKTTNLSQKSQEMQDTINLYTDFVEANFEDGEIKNRLIKQVREYTKTDKNGNSKFKNDIMDDYNTCIKYANIKEDEIVFN
ncbi:MAG: hypothetical protein IJW82_01565 [Clostridia bacterium]|nr:hypothetical protein [Clostridia bacterium]